MRAKKIPYALLITQISKKDYTDFPDVSKNFVPEGNIMECELGKLLVERTPHPENILCRHVGIDHRCQKNGVDQEVREIPLPFLFQEDAVVNVLPSCKDYQGGFWEH
jgi:hypothetical protein